VLRISSTTVRVTGIFGGQQLILIGLGFSRRLKTKEFQNVKENFQNFEERQI